MEAGDYSVAGRLLMRRILVLLIVVLIAPWLAAQSLCIYHIGADQADAGFTIQSIEPYKIYSKASPAVFPERLIKAERSA